MENDDRSSWISKSKEKDSLFAKCVGDNGLILLGICLNTTYSKFIISHTWNDGIQKKNKREWERLASYLKLPLAQIFPFPFFYRREIIHQTKGN